MRPRFMSAVIVPLLALAVFAIGTNTHAAAAKKTIMDVKPPFTFKIHVQTPDGQPQPGVKIHCLHPRKERGKPLVELDSISDASGLAEFHVTRGDLLNERWYWFSIADEKFVGGSGFGISPLDNEYEHAFKVAPAEPFKIRVTDEESSPIAGAKLCIINDNPKFPDSEDDAFMAIATADTTSDGLAVAHFMAAPANIIASANGYASSFIRGATLPKDKPYGVKLSKGLTIRGKVLDNEGKPVTGASVTAQQSKFAMNYYPEFILKAESNQAGEFELKTAAAAKYDIQTVLQGGERGLSFDSVEANPKVQSALVEIHGKPGALIKGRYVTKQKLPLGKQQIWVSSMNPTVRRYTSHEYETAPDGTFSVSIPSDQRGRVSFLGVSGYSIVVNFPKKTPSLEVSGQGLDFDHVPPGVYDGVEVNFILGAILNVVVRDADGKPVADVQVESEPGGIVARTDANGKFSGEIAPNRRFTLKLTEEDSVKSIFKTTKPFLAGEGEIVTQEIKLSREATEKLAKLMDRDNAIVGQVVGPDGKPAANATVYLGNSSVLAQNHGTPTWEDGIVQPAYLSADAKGTFTFNNLMPGKTELWAEDGKRNRGWARDVKSDAVDVTITLKPRESLITLKGTLLEPDGKPAADAQLRIYNTYNQTDVAASGKTDAAGRFTIEFKPPREGWMSNQYHYLRAVAISKSGAIAWKTLPYCSREDIKLQFKKVATVSGRVVDSNRKPVKDAKVQIYYANDPDYGMAYGSSEDLTPPAKTGADGRFTIPGIAATSDLGISVEHPDYIKNHTYNGNQEDVVMSEGVIVSGTVRHAENNAPAGGTTVTLQTLSSNRSTVTNAKGEYRMQGIEPMPHGVNLIAIGPTWFGRGSFDKKLVEGADLKGLDIVVRDTPAALKSQPVQSKGK